MSEKNFFQAKQTINIQGKLIDLSEAKVMGIINATPDSFYTNSRAQTIEDALFKAEEHLKAGATFLDIGAYSTRPGCADISTEEELSRLCPVIESIHKNFPEAKLSIDTFRAQVAEESILRGAHIINDISAGDLDPMMFETVAKLNVPYLMMHMQGNPQNMQNNANYQEVVTEVIDYLAQKINTLSKLHVHDIIIDPGFGFGKTTDHNYQLLKHLENFKIFRLPILVGFSRKGMIYKTLKTDASAALNGTSVLNTIALQKGAGILRVHDVKEALECIKLVAQLNAVS